MLSNLLKRYKFHVATILIALLIIEGLSYASFILVINRAARSFIYYDYDKTRTSVTQQELQRFKLSHYDYVTGWLPTPNKGVKHTDKDGISWSYTISNDLSRYNPYAADRVRISAYGDSFTFGEQVSDDQTWSYILSQLTRTRVKNWGVGGYGTDQALLRLKQNLPKHRTEIVVLGVYSENINRLMNSYRLFYANSSEAGLNFKPMLHNNGGRLEWLPNPLAYESNTIEDYYRAYDKASQVDYWYALNQKKAMVKFPYTLALMRATYFYLSEGSRPNLYKLDAATERLDRILEEFQALARQYDFVGVVLFIPTSDALKQEQRTGTYDYSDYVARVRSRRELDRLRVVNIIEKPFNREKFNLVPFMYHASPYGNKIIAEAVHEAIKDRF